jgi:protein-tyrosine phosphatase
MRPELFRITTDGPGRLATMARPRGGDRLAEELAGLVAAGVEEVVCLLSPDELAELELTEEPALAAAHGLAFHHLPTPDFTAPDPAAGGDLAVRLHERLRAGASIVVHCRGGIGRSSTIAAAVLVLDGLTPDEAWRRISAARGLPVPETADQVAFVERIAR